MELAGANSHKVSFLYPGNIRLVGAPYLRWDKRKLSIATQSDARSNVIVLL